MQHFCCFCQQLDIPAGCPTCPWACHAPKWRLLAQVVPGNHALSQQIQPAMTCNCTCASGHHWSSGACLEFDSHPSLPPTSLSSSSLTSKGASCQQASSAAGNAEVEGAGLSGPPVTIAIEHAINMLLARVAFDLLRSPKFKQQVMAHIQKKLDELKVPDYINALQVVCGPCSELCTILKRTVHIASDSTTACNLCPVVKLGLIYTSQASDIMPAFSARVQSVG